MAEAPKCDLCSEEPAEWVFGNLVDPPKWLGTGCLARFGLQVAKDVLPAEEIAETIGPLFVNMPEPKPEPQAEPKRPSRKKAAKATQPEPVRETAAEVAEDAAAAENG